MVQIQTLTSWSWRKEGFATRRSGYRLLTSTLCANFVTLDTVGTIQCDAIRWEQLENRHFLRGYNLWTNDLNPYSSVFVSRKSFFLYGSCLNVCFISWWKVSVFELFQSQSITLYENNRITMKKQKYQAFERQIFLTCLPCPEIWT